MHLADSISTDYYEKLLGNHTTFLYSEKIMSALNIDIETVANISKELPSAIDKLYKIIVF